MRTYYAVLGAMGIVLALFCWEYALIVPIKASAFSLWSLGAACLACELVVFLSAMMLFWYTWPPQRVFSFTVVDVTTGAAPDVKAIACTEDWADGVVFCDATHFAIDQHGALLLLDSCGNYVYCPDGRFEVKGGWSANAPTV